ncbi:hypothetical protein [Methanobrevibacter arboriphilus]|uniref:hypothetical protein n=1 Tax=Methanobrevibacter arboriphilus TaxID=39441 RepID=UPI001CDB1A8D|nr:hypothetical protein [Methanobrevibacter arboriphilus]
MSSFVNSSNILSRSSIGILASAVNTPVAFPSVVLFFILSVGFIWGMLVISKLPSLSSPISIFLFSFSLDIKSLKGFI